jgi:hypothetical protein
MTPRMVIGTLVMTCVLALPAYSGGKGQLQKYFSDAATHVKATENPSEKRYILDESFRTISKALDMMQGSPLLSTGDEASTRLVRARIQEQRDELAGNNGYVRVPDAQLNAFSDYVVQDMEQADQVITISVVTLLLILIVVILLLR